MPRHATKLNRQRKTLGAVRGAWNPEDHPELDQGAAKWVRGLRQDSAKRFEKIEQRRVSE